MKFMNVFLYYYKLLRCPFLPFYKREHCTLLPPTKMHLPTSFFIDTFLCTINSLLNGKESQIIQLAEALMLSVLPLERLQNKAYGRITEMLTSMKMLSA